MDAPGLRNAWPGVAIPGIDHNRRVPALTRSALMPAVVVLSGVLAASLAHAASTAAPAAAAASAAKPSAGVAKSPGKPLPVLTGESLQQALRQGNCLTCHAMDRKLIGPAFASVHKKYRDVSGAEAALTHKVLEGGSGVWGVLPMPANLQLSEAQARLIVRSLLAPTAFVAP